MSKRYKVTGRQYNSKNCIVCGLSNELGLKAEFYETDSKEVVALCTPRFEHQSYPGRVHGGIACALLDETIGRAMCIGSSEMIWGVTVELNMKYRKPLPYDEPIKIVGRITCDKGRLAEGSGEIYLENGEVAVEASGVYMKMPVRKIADGDFEDSDQWGLNRDKPLPEYIDI